jgi:hypothetical protein
MANRKEQICYVPLADRDFGLRGFEFEADAVVMDAMKRWAVGTHQCSYEDFLRKAYWREAELADGFVVDLSRDAESPLTFDQCMTASPYSLSVWYEAGEYSKHFRGTYGAGTLIVMGDECQTCHSFERNTKGKCAPCLLAAQHHQQAGYRLAHPEIEEARLAKQKAREEKWEAQRVAAEEDAALKRKARELHQAEAAARKAAREAATRAAVLDRAAAREAERIRDKRERDAIHWEKSISKAVENKFEGPPCRKCGGTTRYIYDRACVTCAINYNRKRLVLTVV